MAYRLISKNMPVPPQLQQILFAAHEALGTNDTRLSGTPASASASAAVPSPASSSSTPAQQQQHQPQSQHTPSQPQPQQGESPLPSTNPTEKTQYNAYASPYNLLKTPVSSYGHASRQQRMLTPSITPIGIDPHVMITERERRIKARIQYRIGELEKIPSNVSTAPASLLSPSDDEKGRDMKLKAIIELRALRLLNRQKKVCCPRAYARSLSLSLRIFV